jgi:hypothetical protein
VFSEGQGVPAQYKAFNSLFSLLGLRELPESFFIDRTLPWLGCAKYKWASEEIYRMIPGVDEFENEMGSEDTGWLFK